MEVSSLPTYLSLSGFPLVIGLSNFYRADRAAAAESDKVGENRVNGYNPNP